MLTISQHLSSMRAARLTHRLLPPYEFGWTLRAANSANVVQIALADGRREVLINYALLTGV